MKTTRENCLTCKGKGKVDVFENELSAYIKRVNRERDLLQHGEVLDRLASIAKSEGLTAYQLIVSCFNGLKPITEARVEAKKILMDSLKEHLLNTLNENIF